METMARHHSRLLQLVVAGLLLGPVADATATTYDDYPIAGVPGSGFFGGSSTTYEYYGGYTDFVLNDFDYSESGGGSGGDGDGGDTTTTPDEAALCSAISELAPIGCNLQNPPVLTTNGCGGGVFAAAVPDYLMINGVPVYQLGPIFRNACNDHDRCYGTYLMGKNACDDQLGVDMVEYARSQMSSTQWLFYRLPVRVQAMGYSNSLQTSVLWISSGLYDTAQKNGACRSYSTQAKENGCLE